MSRTPARYLLPCQFTLIAALGISAARAQTGPGDLLVAPTRIVFEGRQRTAEITLVNTGSATATYRITFVNLRMNEHGETIEIDPAGALPGERFANDLIRYSPRQVTLEPRLAQTVRMQLRLPAALEPGEYRSHLLFRAELPAAAPTSTVGPANGLSVQLTPIYGVSIPVIVRHGETSGAAALSDLTLVPAVVEGAPATLRFQIRRTGNRSVHGNLTATFLPAGGKPTVVGVVNGFAVYSPNPTRRAAMTLRAPPGMRLEHGRVVLAFTKQAAGNEMMAQADLRVE